MVCNGPTFTEWKGTITHTALLIKWHHSLLLEWQQYIRPLVTIRKVPSLYIGPLATIRKVPSMALFFLLEWQQYIEPLATVRKLICLTFAPNSPSLFGRGQMHI
jgi:hypothetical protein